MSSYAVAYLIAHMKRVDLVKSAGVPMCRAMHGEKMARELGRNPLSNDIVTRRSHDISDDIRCQLIDRVKIVRYALQVEELNDV